MESKTSSLPEEAAEEAALEDAVVFFGAGLFTGVAVFPFMLSKKRWKGLVGWVFLL